MSLDVEWLCDSQNVVKIENREKIDTVMVLLKSVTRRLLQIFDHSWDTFGEGC